MALALLGLGPGALAMEAEDSGGHGAWRHGSGILELDQRRNPESDTTLPAGPNARMQPDSGSALSGMDTVDNEGVSVDVIPMSAMNALYHLRAGQYAQVCKSRKHLCGLIAAHVRTRIGRTAPKPPRTAQPPLPGKTPPRLQDATLASYVGLHAQRRPERNRTSAEHWH